MLSKFAVGVITKPHGIRGEVKVHVLSDDPDRLSDLKEVEADGPKYHGMLTMEGVRYFKGQAIVKFRGFDTMDDTMPLLRAQLLIPREEALPLEEREYYIGDLIGMQVYQEDGRLLGTLRDVLQTGANDVYEVSTEEYGDILIPAIRECIRDVSVEEGSMTVRLMKGLLD